MSQFKLNAFDSEIELEDAARTLQELLTRMSTHLEEEVRQQVAAVAEKSGTPIEQLMATGPMGNLVLRMSIEFCGSDASQ